MKLELKHLAPYLPYGLKIKLDLEVLELKGLDDWHLIIDKQNSHNEFIAMPIGIKSHKPILRPLSDLFIKRFDDENGGLRHIDIISSKIFFDNHIDEVTTHANFWYGLINSMVYPTLSQSKELTDFLYENHYDVEALFNNGNGLIEKGLAIDINSLTKEANNKT